MSGKSDPFPADYATIVTQRQLLPNEMALVSTPRQTKPWGAFDPIAWYVCIKRADGSESVAFIKAGRVSGTIVPAPVEFCAAAEYQAVGRGLV